MHASPPRAAARDRAVAEHLAVGGQPQLVDATAGQFSALTALAVERILEAVSRDLAKDGGHRLVELFELGARGTELDSLLAGHPPRWPAKDFACARAS